MGENGIGLTKNGLERAAFCPRKQESERAPFPRLREKCQFFMSLKISDDKSATPRYNPACANTRFFQLKTKD